MRINFTLEFRVWYTYPFIQKLKKKLNESKQNDGDDPLAISYVKQNLLHANWHVYIKCIFFLCSQWPFEKKNENREIFSIVVVTI